MREHSLAEQRAEKKRAQIRVAAKELFLQSGFQATSMDAILAASGIASKDTLYRYYAKKEDLFGDVLRLVTPASLHLVQLKERRSDGFASAFSLRSWIWPRTARCQSAPINGGKPL